MLGYHRIADSADDPFGLCTSPARFSEHLALLRRVGRPIALAEMSAALRRGTLPRRAVVVTLDDGYADSLHHAMPALQAHEVPATVFVTSGLMGREPWWDRLARLLRASGPAASATIESWGRTSGWNPAHAAGTDANPADRIRRLHRALLGSPAAARDSALDELERRLGTSDAGVPDARGLEPDELRRLAEWDGIEVGAHGVSHPMLAQLPPAAQRIEIEESRRTLETLIGARVCAFSYPNGSHSALTRALVRECGFESACASFEGVASRRSDPFALPRMWVGDLDPGALASRLRIWG